MIAASPIVGLMFFSGLDYFMLAGYFVGILGLGFYFWRRNDTADEFTAAGRSLPGWLCGLSIFATYLSSISYLALPGKAFVDNWNAFMFSLAIPFAAAIAVRYFLPLYRSSGEVSAYALLERRFGLWARIYASCFYLLYQIARIGVVMYLMALPMAVLFEWDIRVLILVTGVIVTPDQRTSAPDVWAVGDAIQVVDAVTGAPTIVHHLRLAAQQVEAFPDALLVRYEDLVGRPVATATRIFENLGLDHGFRTVRAAVGHAVDARSDEHVTTASAAASIGRWRGELPAAAAAHLVAELTDELARFGYDR